jgi:hypothetical protein
VIVHHREPTDGHGEDFRKFLEPVFESLPPVVVSFSEQERLAYTARHAVVRPGHGQINQFRSSDCHGKSPVGLLRGTVRNARRFVEVGLAACLQKSTSRWVQPDSTQARGYAVRVFSFRGAVRRRGIGDRLSRQLESRRACLPMGVGAVSRRSRVEFPIRSSFARLKPTTARTSPQRAGVLKS